MIGGNRTAWRLAATYALAGKVADKPDLTKRLHAVIGRPLEPTLLELKDDDKPITCRNLAGPI
jgi:hypothetical protein